MPPDFTVQDRCRSPAVADAAGASCLIFGRKAKSPGLKVRIVASMLLVRRLEAGADVYASRPSRCRPSSTHGHGGDRGAVMLVMALAVGVCGGAVRIGSVRQRCATRFSNASGRTRPERLAATVFRHLHQLIAALPSRTPHRRGHQGGRARHQEHRHDALFHAVQHRADGARAGDGRCRSSGAKFGFWLVAATLVMVALYIVFTRIVTDWRNALRAEMNDLDTGAVAHAVDSLLNFETVKYFGAEEREARALRPRDGRLRDRGGEEPDVACLAQHRPVADHQCDDGGRDGAGRLGLEPGPVQRRQRGAGLSTLADAAVPPARSARHGLSHDPAGRNRHGGDVRPDRYAIRGGRCAGRGAAGGDARPCAVRGRALRLRSRTHDPEGDRSRYPAQAIRWRWSARRARANRRSRG